MCVLACDIFLLLFSWSQESEHDGLLIVKGRYGNLESPGGYIDVTDQLQNLVDSSCLIYKVHMKPFAFGIIILASVFYMNILLSCLESNIYLNFCRVAGQ
jgi:hypothetical protein